MYIHISISISLSIYVYVYIYIYIYIHTYICTCLFPTDSPRHPPADAHLSGGMLQRACGFSGGRSSGIRRTFFANRGGSNQAAGSLAFFLSGGMLLHKKSLGHPAKAQNLKS